jgi:L-alanine-DL-glutamate epimerase-like enolase superfamily enzyme
MRIVDVSTQSFRSRSQTVRDSEGHAHPGPEHDTVQHVLRIATDEGVEGFCFGASPDAIRSVVGPALLGEDPWDREKLWQRLRKMQRLHLSSLTDHLLGTVDMALWDLAGRATGLPVYKLLGGYKDKIKAYASTMCGDDLEGGLNSPQAYADFARQCQARGYTALKLHTIMPPVPGTPDPKLDVACCRAVREAVGDDMVLMLDSYHDYSREEAYFIGRELEKLNYYWLEEPMPEHSMSSYIWLAGQLSIPILGPETAEGKMFTRAEWILRGAADISRAGVGDVGGITPVIKIAHLCESFGVRLEIHGGGAGNLQALCAMGIPGEYYERGLLHPFLDHEQPAPWLNALDDPMDADGYVHVSKLPGLGQDINWDYIREHAIPGT